MLSTAEQQVLEAVCSNAKSALFDIRTAMGKVYDDELALTLNRQAAKYSKMEELATDHLLENGIVPEPIGVLDRTRRWATWQAQTAMNVSTGHVAEMILRGEKERNEKLQFALQNHQDHSGFAYEIADEFIHFKEEIMSDLETYL